MRDEKTLTPYESTDVVCCIDYRFVRCYADLVANFRVWAGEVTLRLCVLAEAVRFELTNGSLRRQFSRLVPSTARPHLR